MVGRMISADPTVPDPMNAQAWNRYSYVGNDPLAFTDPSGFSWLSSFFHSVSNFLRSNSIVRSILQIATTILLNAIIPGSGILVGVLAAAASAAIVTGLSGGNLGQALRAGLIAGATALAFNAVGDFTGHTPTFGTPAYAENVAGHALVGCASSAASGGSCESGALSGAVGSALSPVTNSLFPDARTDLGQRIGGTIMEATAGGLASVAGGGKFANGAVTGAFGYLFNFLGCSPSVQKCIASDPTNAEYAQHWLDGNGWPVLRLGDNVDLSDYPSGAFSGTSFAPSAGTFWKAWSNVQSGTATQADQDIILYGSISFKNTGPGVIQINDDTYNFDWESGRFARNLMTQYLKEQSVGLNASGKNFKTIFIGSTKTP